MLAVAIAGCSQGVYVAPSGTPTPAPSSASTTSALVSGQPIAIPQIGGLSGTVTFTASSGAFPSGVMVVLTSSLTAPAGAPAPQSRFRFDRRRLDDGGPQTVGYLQMNYAASYAQVIMGKVVVMLDSGTPIFSAFGAYSPPDVETFNLTTGGPPLISPMYGGAGNSDAYSTSEVPMSLDTSDTYLAEIVENSAASPTPTENPIPSPTASVAPTPSPTPTVNANP